MQVGMCTILFLWLLLSRKDVGITCLGPLTPPARPFQLTCVALVCREIYFILFQFLLCCRALQEAQDIFGVDFNYEEFEQYEYEDDFDDEEVTAWCRSA